MDAFDPIFIPLLVAVIAALVSLLGLIISKENRISDFRQAWIDALRAEIVGLIARAYDLNRSRCSPGSQPGRTDMLHLEQALAQIDMRLKTPTTKTHNPSSKRPKL